MRLSDTDLLFDQQHIWHPYTSMLQPLPQFAVSHCEGCYIHLDTGEKLLDGMASWWSAIHGYNHPTLNKAVTEQTQNMAHVMFGGLTHEPAIRLCQTLVEITPKGLEKVFLADSGSVSMEVAMKMALQYFQAQGHSEKHRFASLKHGYHGDTFQTMSVSDPENGMHHLFSEVLPKQLHFPAPEAGFNTPPSADIKQQYRDLFAKHHGQLAGFIAEPIVQGAGGMRFYHPDYLLLFNRLCSEFNVLFICDEIATGFGRTGELFAVNHAGICPDILAIGKSLTGGYMTLAATLCTEQVAQGICQGEAGVFMHGPTFMGNPLACAVANASLQLLLQSNWQANIKRIEEALTEGFAAVNAINGVREVRTLGAIGVIELEQAVDMAVLQPMLVKHGLWVRPFGKLVYVMPPFIMTNKQIGFLSQGLHTVLSEYLGH